MTPLLSWAAQVAAHAAYVAAHPAALTEAATTRRTGKSGRGSTAQADRNREALLHALRDGKSHPFADIVAALPGLSRNGIYYLIEGLRDEGRLVLTRADRGNRRYRLT